MRDVCVCVGGLNVSFGGMVWYGMVWWVEVFS